MTYDRGKADKLLATALEHAANVVSGLELSDIDEDGHLVANKLWKISAYLRRREAMRADFGDSFDDAPE
jgi:hypothetical protein